MTNLSASQSRRGYSSQRHWGFKTYTPCCQICRGDHYADRCPKYLNTTQDISYAHPTQSSRTNFNSIIDWCIDSGASAHMTNQTSALDSYKPYSGPDSVIVGNGNILNISHIGSRTLSSDVQLLDVLVVPHITKNLLSISKLTSDFPVDVIFSDKVFEIRNRVTKKLLAQGRCDRGLYMLDRGVPALVSAVRNNGLKASFALWHLRLGHVPLSTISLLNKLVNSSQGQLEVGFYGNSCPDVEAVVGGVVRDAFASDPTTAPVLLRLHFHDCFVEGCDASILIDNGEESDERHAFGHQGVRGFDVIERAKAEVEAVCPGIVSCADIVALAAREAITLANGPFYEVELGRRDGMVSNVGLADDMPDVTDSIDTLKTKFLQKGLTDKDLVLLSAAHSIGTAACFFMTDRLYNFPGSDPSINPAFLPELMSTCPKNGDVNVRLAMDRGSEQTLDTQLLKNIRSGFAVLQSDAALYQDAATKAVVDSYLSGSSFQADFTDAVVRMGRIGVLTGDQGTIRQTCASFT